MSKDHGTTLTHRLTEGGIGALKMTDMKMQDMKLHDKNPVLTDYIALL